MSENKKPDTVKAMMEVLPAGWDRAPITIAHEIKVFLESVKDQGTSVDSGTDGLSADLWVTVQGIEYYLNLRKSNGQLQKEGKIIPSPDDKRGDPRPL